jgi:AraC-like DNA-binding protein
VRRAAWRVMQNRSVDAQTGTGSGPGAGSDAGPGARNWARYWRAPDDSFEVMRAHFETHRYYKHSHETYSFGVTESGAQTFTFRGARRTSAAGMVMAFNPDDPHDGHATTALGFTYSIVYIPESAVTDVLGDQRGRRVGAPLFAEPVLHDRAAADALRRLSATVAGGQRLAVDEVRDEAIRALVRCTPLRAGGLAAGLSELPGLSKQAELPGRPGSGLSGLPLPRRRDTGVLRVRDLLRAEYVREFGAEELARVAGCSRFALYRAFVAEYGMSPGDYQRQLRLRAARTLLAQGLSPAQAASEAGFTDQAHLTRWFGRCYGITPARYRAAVSTGGSRRAAQSQQIV